MPSQPTLFDVPASPVTFVTRCHLCQEPVAAIKLDDPGDPWQAPILWGYVALKAHERQSHDG